MKIRQLLESTKLTYQDFQDVLEFVGQQWTPPHPYGQLEPNYANMDKVTDDGMKIFAQYIKTKASGGNAADLYNAYLKIQSTARDINPRGNTVTDFGAAIEKVGSELPDVVRDEAKQILTKARELSLLCLHTEEHANLANATSQRLFSLYSYGQKMKDDPDHQDHYKVVRAFFRSHGVEL